MMQRLKFQLPVLWLTYSLLTGCAYFTEPEVDPEKIEKIQVDAVSLKATTFYYECAEGFDFTVSAGNDEAWVFLMDETLKLEAVPSASGVKYANDQVSFWNKGDEAILDLGASRYTNCKNNKAKAIWENSKLKGIDFRAIGNEPTWIVELINDRTVVFTLLKGKMMQYVFTATTPETNVDTRTSVYSLESDEHDMVMTVVGDTCNDTMADETYESTVMIKLDGQVFNGCGKALH